jgi:hypothetical protein
MDMACSMGMDMEHGHGHGAWTWTCSMNMDMQRGFCGMDDLDSGHVRMHGCWNGNKKLNPASLVFR